ncbi:hypothetical protein MJM99_16495, partial [Salmonella enterica subsp. enterica serovar Kentucky]|nr:hypothetical protein [Salmonella enterica subsp. enterica serovar Kentucky]
IYRVGSGKLMSRGGGITTENDFASFPPSSSNPFPLRYPYKIRVKQRQLNCFVTRDVRWALQKSVSL